MCTSVLVGHLQTQCFYPALESTGMPSAVPAHMCVRMCARVSCPSAEPEVFSVENDLITPTFKYKRPQLQRRYEVEIDAMYKALRGNSNVSSYAPSRAISRATSKPGVEIEATHVIRAKAH